MQTANVEESLIAYAAVNAHIKQHGPKKGERGKILIPCPVCKEDFLFVSVHTNGHTWGKCRGKNCKVSWIE